MKLKHTFLFVLLFFVGIISIKAVESFNQDQYQILYNNIKEYYLVIGAEVYYYNNAASVDKKFESELNQIWDRSISLFKPSISKSELNEIFTAGFGNGENLTAFVVKMKEKLNHLIDIEDINVLNEMEKFTGGANGLASYNSLPEMFSYTKNTLMNYKNKINTIEYNNDYDNLILDTKNAYSTFCEYLKKHDGVSYYIKTVLKIISYAVLALAIILGGVDFVEAILSNEDNALNKAFQKFVRRLIAAVLVFLAYVIVQTFLGLVTGLPGVDGENTKICDELKIGTLK